MGQIKWLTVATLIVLFLATVQEWYWVWGVLFIYWGIGGIRSGAAFLVEDISRAESPILFWLISAMWIGFGVFYVYGDLSVRLTQL